MSSQLATALGEPMAPGSAEAVASTLPDLASLSADLPGLLDPATLVTDLFGGSSVPPLRRFHVPPPF